MSRDSRDLAREYARAGFRVELGKGSHYKVRDGAGHLVSVFAGTPSDGRSIRNARAQMRRAIRQRGLEAA